MNQFVIVHGLGETTNSDWTGTDTLSRHLEALYPNDRFLEVTEAALDGISLMSVDGKRIGIGNSYGVSAIVRHADSNPQEVWDLVVMLDGVPRLDKKPRQYACTEWKQRSNIRQILSFKENVSLLGMMTGTCRAPIDGIYDASIKATKRTSDWFTEYLLDRDTYNPVSDFLTHFTLETAHPWVKDETLRTITRTLL